MTIGERLLELRKAKKYTQAYVAKIIGCRNQTIFKYEKDIVNIPVDKIEKLAEIYGVTPGYILGYDEEIISLKKKKLIDDILTLQESDIDILVSMVNRLKGEK